MYDYLIVGSGLFGSIFANQLNESGKKVLVIEKRNHIGGNCFTENIEDIHIHKYGPHIFHTSDDRVWEFINKFVDFNNFINRPKVNYKNNLYSFPINLMTFYQLYGVQNPQDAKKIIEEKKLKIQNPKNLEDWVLSEVGQEIYETFIKGYTTKQWNKNPKELPTSIIKRIPIRFNFDDNYYFDKYQGIPIGGYTQIFENLLKNIEVKTNVDYFNDKNYFNSIANKIIYTGPVDLYFNYVFGKLEYRSLKFETEYLNINDFQGNAIINYTDYEIPYTRIIEHKHFDFQNQKNTIITREYPQNFGDPFYPVNDNENNLKYIKYKNLMNLEKNVIFGGRLADYKYYDMHQVIASALSKSKKEIN